MTQIFINSGFGAELGAETLAHIKSIGFSGVRQDILNPESARALTAEIAEAGLFGLYICRDAESARATAACTIGSRAAIEVGNEEDRHGKPKEYHRQFMDIYRTVRNISRGLPIYTCGITTTDSKRLQWLESVYALGIPDDVGCALHTYRTHTGPDQPHPTFSSRADEYEMVRLIVGPKRPLIVSEVGWHTARSKVPSFICNVFGLCKYVQFTEEQVAASFEREVQIAEENGVESVTLFQWNCGPDPAQYEHQFGVRRFDGSERPICDTVRRLARG